MPTSTPSDSITSPAQHAPPHRPEERANVAVIEAWLSAFNGRWPTDDDLDRLLTPDAVFVERPNLANPTGSERPRAAFRAGLEAGARLLCEQHYEPLEHVAAGDRVVTRIRWTATIGADAGPWKAGTRLSAWCTAIYRLRDHRICHIEQFDCYDPPQPPSTPENEG